MIEDESSWEYWEIENDEMLLERKLVLNVMHACKNARAVSRQTYILDLDSIIEKENEPLWTDPENDLVYFQLVGAIRAPAKGYEPFHRQERSPEAQLAMLAFLSRRDVVNARKPGYKRVSCLSSIRHIAFRVNNALHHAIGIHDQVMWDYCWLENFPALESFSLFFDPSNLHITWDTGRIVLFEPFDYPIASTGRTVSRYVADFKRNLTEMHGLDEDGMEMSIAERWGNTEGMLLGDARKAPDVEAYVIERRRHRRTRGRGV